MSVQHADAACCCGDCTVAAGDLQPGPGPTLLRGGGNRCLAKWPCGTGNGVSFVDGKPMSQPTHGSGRHSPVRSRPILIQACSALWSLRTAAPKPAPRSQSDPARSRSVFRFQRDWLLCFPKKDKASTSSEHIRCGGIVLCSWLQTLKAMTALDRSQCQVQIPLCYHQCNQAATLSMLGLGLCGLNGGNASGVDHWACAFPTMEAVASGGPDVLVH